MNSMIVCNVSHTFFEYHEIRSDKFQIKVVGTLKEKPFERESIIFLQRVCGFCRIQRGFTGHR